MPDDVDVGRIHVRLTCKHVGCCENVVDFVVERRELSPLAVLAAQDRRHHDKAASRNGSVAAQSLRSKPTLVRMTQVCSREMTTNPLVRSTALGMVMAVPVVAGNRRASPPRILLCWMTGERHGIDSMVRT